MFKKIKNWGKNLLYSGVILAGSLGFNGCNLPKTSYIPEQKYEIVADNDGINMHSSGRTISSVNEAIGLGSTALIKNTCLDNAVGRFINLIFTRKLSAIASTTQHEVSHAKLNRKYDLTHKIRVDWRDNTGYNTPLWALDESEFNKFDKIFNGNQSKEYTIPSTVDGINSEANLAHQTAEGFLDTHTFVDSCLYFRSKYSTAEYIIEDGIYNSNYDGPINPIEFGDIYIYTSELSGLVPGVSKGSIILTKKDFKNAGKFALLDPMLLKVVYDWYNYVVNGDVTGKQLKFMISPDVHLTTKGIEYGINTYLNNPDIVLSVRQNKTNHDEWGVGLKLLNYNLTDSIKINIGGSVWRQRNFKDDMKYGSSADLRLEQMFGNSFGLSAGIHAKSKGYERGYDDKDYIIGDLGLVFKF